jgi:hypothetical protein
MRGRSPAAETGHVWAAAAHISPLGKVAGPPMINSTGEQNGYTRGSRWGADYALCSVSSVAQQRTGNARVFAAISYGSCSSL